MSESRKEKRGRPRTRFQSDVRLTVRFCPGRDDDLLAWLAELPDRQRARRIRQVLRSGLNGHEVGQGMQGQR